MVLVGPHGRPGLLNFGRWMPILPHGRALLGPVVLVGPHGRPWFGPVVHLRHMVGPGFWSGGTSCATW